MTPVPSDEPPPKKRTASDYKFGKVIGEGSFSTVYLAKDIHSNMEFAIKVLQKQHIIREKKMDYVTREKNAMLKLTPCNRLFVRLYATFQDVERLYFVLSYAKHSDLLAHINSDFSMECSKFYAAELLLALEILKTKQIIHRDLKPENILLDEGWHILLTDFGSSKIVSDDVQEAPTPEVVSNSQRKNSFVGTAQFVTPEVLSNGRVTYAADLWAFGCILFQMITGTMPFSGPTDYLIFKKILDLNFEFPSSFDPAAKDLVSRLLVLEPSERLGCDDERPYTSIREHEFFAGIDWDDLGVPPLSKDRCNTLESSEEISDELEPGFDDRKAGRLHLEMFAATPTRKKSEANRNIADVDSSERERRIALQRGDKWHQFVEGNLILKQGLIEKRKGLFPKRRMLLLTLGPHLYYVDPDAMVLKGEIPWSADLRPEAKNFRTFHVHTPNRTYYLEDPEGYALEWCRCIDEVKAFYYPTSK